MSIEIPEGWQLVPKLMTHSMHHAAREQMPVEYKYWQEDRMLHCKMLPMHECVDPQKVYAAALEAAPKSGIGDIF